MNASTKSKVKIISCCVAIFVAGMVTGSIVTGEAFHYLLLRRGNPDQLASTWMLGLKYKLKLTPEQATKIKPIVEEAALRVRHGIDVQTREYHQALTEAQAGMEPVLNPEQQKTLHALIQTRRDRYKMVTGEGEMAPEDHSAPAKND